MTESQSMRRARRRAFTLVESLLAAGLCVVVLGVVVLLARSFVVGFIWGEGTWSGVQRAAFLHATLRRDLTRTDLAGEPPALTVVAGPGSLEITSPGETQGATRVVTYRLDVAKATLFRTVRGQPPQALGTGQVIGFEARTVCQVRDADGQVRQSAAPAAGERAARLGVALTLRLQTSDLKGAGGAARTLDFTTHVFPPFANRSLVSVWKRIIR